MRIGVCILFFLVHLLCQSRGSKESGEVMDRMFNGSYDKRIRPFANMKPLEVSMSAYILDVYDIDEVRHEFTVTMYLRHLWRDPRLEKAFRKTEVEAVLLDAEHAQKLWLPDTFIVNLRKLESPDVFNEATKVTSDGSIVRSTRTSATASCKFYLGYFPFDVQLCSLDFESYGSSAHEFYYKWKEDSLNFVQVSSDTTNPRFHVSNVVSKESMMTIQGTNFSRFSMEFTLVRSSSRYLTDIYFPIAALAIVSFMTFAMSQYALKLQISCFIMAIMAVLTSLSLSKLPQLSHHTALDLYLFFCFGLTFLVVISHFILAHIKRPGDKRREVIEMGEVRRGLQASRDTLSEDHFRLGRPTFGFVLENAVYMSFCKASAVIPILFISFNCAYWTAIIIGSVSAMTSQALPVPTEDLLQE